MPDAEVEAALAHWAPRFIQNGVDYNDFVRTVQRIDTWDQWLPEWSRTADEQAELARESDATGHRDTAGHAWRRAATDRHFGKFVWMVDLDLAAEAGRRSVEEMRAAHLGSTPPPSGSRSLSTAAPPTPTCDVRPGPTGRRTSCWSPAWTPPRRSSSTSSRASSTAASPPSRSTAPARARPGWPTADPPRLRGRGHPPARRAGRPHRPGPRPDRRSAGSAWAATTRPGPPPSSPGCGPSRASADRSASATCGTTCRR